MDKNIERSPRNISRGLYHHGIIKTLIMEELNKRNDTWGDFLNCNRFHEYIVFIDNVINTSEYLISFRDEDFIVRT